MNDREKQRSDNRARMPETAKIFDEITKVFGSGCKIIYARENGIEVGQPFDRSKLVTPDVSENLSRKPRKR